MAKRTLFHGTTFENYLLIMKNGFSPEDMVWSCSDDSEMYFYDDTKDGNYILDWGNIEDLHNELIRNAFESAQITASVQGFTGNKLIVFELSVDEELIEDDYSCDNMSDVASVVSVDDLSLDMITNIYVSDTAYNPHLRFFYISGIYNRNKYLNKDNFDSIEVQALEVLSQSEFYIDELLELDWQVLNFNRLAVA